MRKSPMREQEGQLRRQRSKAIAKKCPLQSLVRFALLSGSFPAATSRPFPQASAKGVDLEEWLVFREVPGAGRVLPRPSLSCG